MVVGAGGGLTAEVGGEPLDNAVMEVSLRDFEKELVMGCAVKCFGFHSCGPCRRLRFIETFCNGRRQFKSWAPKRSHLVSNFLVPKELNKKSIKHII